MKTTAAGGRRPVVVGPRLVRAAARAAVACGLAAPALRRRLRLPLALVAVTAYAAPVGVAVAARRSRARDVAVCAAYMWAHLAMYEMPNDDPERLRARARVRYPIRADLVLGLGELAGVRLQRALARTDRTTALDAALVWAHWLWFLVPHAAVAYTLVRHPARFPRAAALVYAVFEAGVAIYWLLPTAPPWYAAQQGELLATPALRRLMVEQGERLWRHRWDRVYGALAGNPLAAMPSLHVATSAMAALVLSDIGAAPGAIGLTYTAILGFALVYLGEHYVVDLIAGVGLALLVRALEAPIAPLLGRARATVAAVEAYAHRPPGRCGTRGWLPPLARGAHC